MPNYFGNMYNGYPQPMPQMQAAQMPQGEMLIPVKSDEEVIRYPIAPGNSLSFRSVTEPYIYTKTLTSQFSQPVVEKYRLVKEDANAEPKVVYATKDELDAVAAKVAELMRGAVKNE